MREWPLASVVVVALVGLGLVADHDQPVRRGLLVVAAALLLGALLRAGLPTGRAGLLAVRGRLIDVALLAAGGAALAVLVLATPSGRG
ncbi:Protein of unknown function (DUF3017) [Motilibacter peucedani]|uniref:DUF3017 family protein n=1 Tax=Motilibacter peucedani TaxID=598650 RepID=A0A420XLQ3_9ACTN|nr:DUF3017 domain-containing protein [Motilibacter peucedani]RKS69355.1 Protein of unknown function (DUF3017) [Motilibacter peucedani]